MEVKPALSVWISEIGYASLNSNTIISLFIGLFLIIFIIYHNIPRQSFIAWLSLRGGLKTLDKLRQWGVVQSDLCVLCWQGQESEQHLFFDCSFSSAVWSYMLQKAGYNRVLANSWQDEIQWVMNRCNGKGCSQDALKLVFNGFIYWIWRERNSRIFENVHKTAIQVATMALNEVRIKLNSIKLEMVAGAELNWFQDTWNVSVNVLHKQQVTCTWEKAEAEVFNLNTDGSLHGDQAGWAAVIRNDEGNVVNAAHGRSRYNSIALIELNALEQGMKLALMNGITRIRAQTDSSNVVSFFKPGYVVPWQANSMMRRIRRMIQDMQFFSIMHIYREANRLADCFASTTPTCVFTEIVPSSFSEDVKKIIYEDRTGQLYVRM